jgi:anaerobic magnesium-protoporphyrin IX monomethyl ester cyclase
MRILFLNAVLGGDFSALDISITQICTYINERTSHKADIADFVFHRKDWKSHLKKIIRKFQPDVIAMSTNTMYMQYVKTFTKEIRTNYEIPIILGGYHVSISPESSIKIKGVKAICIGDGEFVTEKFLDALEHGKTMKGIQGLWVKENGKIIRNKQGCFIKNIDQFPTPNWDHWRDLKKYFYYLGMLYAIGTRGCPYRCSFCDAHQISQSVDGQYYRIRDPEKYADELIYQWHKYEKKGLRVMQLFDQLLTMDDKWLKKFLDRYREEGHADKWKFSSFSRIDHLNENKIKMLAKSGCSVLRMGVEAGNDFIRNQVYKKNLTKDKIRKIYRLCKKHGIAITSFNMVGGPGENRKTINETINFARELKAERSAFFVFKPFTKESEEILKKYGGTIDQEKWKKANNITFDAVVKLKDISPRQVELLQYKAYLTTFSQRLKWMVGENPIKYTTRFIKYVGSGVKDGLDIKYLVPYFHIYGYDYGTR